jgi:hypothetical protein
VEPAAHRAAERPARVALHRRQIPAPTDRADAPDSILKPPGQSKKRDNSRDP